MDKKYTYIIVDVADMFYEENIFDAKFDDYNEARDYLTEKNLITLRDKLDWLEHNKAKFGTTTLVVSYW